MQIGQVKSKQGKLICLKVYLNGKVAGIWLE